MKKVILLALAMCFCACENTVIPQETGSCFYATKDMKSRTHVDKVTSCKDSVIVNDTTYYLISSGVIVNFD